MIETSHPELSLVRQCELIGISRSGGYYEPKGESELNLCVMRLIGLRAVAQQPNTSRRPPGHKVYPYQLAELDVERRNQVWCADLTYLPMAHGFLYLVAGY